MNATNASKLSARFWVVYAAVCGLGLAVNWPGIGAWFQRDDFYWLTLPLQLSSGKSLSSILFEPQAQGTVRVLSERIYFLLLGSLPGPPVWPFRVCAFAAYFGIIWLIMRHVMVMTASVPSAAVSGIMFAASASNAPLLAWSSAFNQLLCGIFLLLAIFQTHAFILTRRRVNYFLMWTCFAAGLLANELMIVYPVMAVTLSLILTKRVPASIWALFVPVTLFLYPHLFVIERDPDSPYRLELNWGIVRPFLLYWHWALGGGRLFSLHLIGRGLSVIVTAFCTAILLMAVIPSVRHQSRHRDPILFFTAWFPIVVSPLAVFQHHITDYYPALPFLGVAILSGYLNADAETEHRAKVRRVLARISLALIVILNLYAAREVSRWYRSQADSARQFVDDLRRTTATLPGTCIVLRNADPAYYRAAIHDRPWVVYGLSKVFGSQEGNLYQSSVLQPPSPAKCPQGMATYDFDGSGLIPVPPRLGRGFEERPKP